MIMHHLPEQITKEANSKAKKIWDKIYFVYKKYKVKKNINTTDGL